MGSKNSLIQQLPLTAGLSKPPLQLNPIMHSSKAIKMEPVSGGPLSSLNFAEKANRPQLDPINLQMKKAGRGISSTSRSGY